MPRQNCIEYHIQRVTTNITKGTNSSSSILDKGSAKGRGNTAATATTGLDVINLAKNTGIHDFLVAVIVFSMQAVLFEESLRLIFNQIGSRHDLHIGLCHIASHMGISDPARTNDANTNLLAGINDRFYMYILKSAQFFVEHFCFLLYNFLNFIQQIIGTDPYTFRTNPVFRLMFSVGNIMGFTVNPYINILHLMLYNASHRTPFSGHLLLSCFRRKKDVLRI